MVVGSFFMIYELISPWKLSRFLVLDMTSLLLNGPELQLKNIWLSSKCCYCTTGDMLPGRSLCFKDIKMGRVIDGFSSLAACTGPSELMRAGPQGGATSGSILPSPLPEVCSVFSRRILLSSPGMQLRTNWHEFYIVQAASWTTRSITRWEFSHACHGEFW